MRAVLRWFVVVVTIIHGLIHLLGVAKGFGWAEVTELDGPISTAGGVTWLIAAALVVSTGVMLAARRRWWWMVGAIAVTISQIVIITAWSDAWAGTAANVMLSAAVVYGFAAHGPTGARAEYRRLVCDALADPQPSEIVTDDDVAGLPAPVAGYVRRSGSGKGFVAQRWSTPIDEYRSFGPRRAIARGSGRWHAPEPEGNFAYLEIEIDAITYNVTADIAPTDRTPSSPTRAAHPVTTPERQQT